VNDDFLDTYTNILENHYLHPGETWFEKAYRLGRNFVKAGFELEEVVELHDNALQRLSEKYPDADFTAERGHYLLVHVLIAYAMSFEAQGELLELRSKALFESEQKYRTLVEQAHDGILIVQKDHIQFANNKLGEMTGHKTETLIQKNLGELMHSPELFKYLNEGLNPSLESPFFVMGNLYTPKGEIPVELSASTILFRQQPAHLLVVRDSRERLNFQRALENRSQRLRALNHIARTVSATLDLDILLPNVYQEIQEIFQPDAFFIALYDPEKKVIDYRFLIDEGQQDTPQQGPLSSDLTSHVIRTGEPLLITDLSKQQADLPGYQTWGTHKVAATWMAVPMILGERVVGVMNVQRYHAYAYDDDHLEFLRTIADQVTVAIENARLYNQAQHEIAQRKAAEEALQTYTSNLESLIDARTDELREAQEQILRQEKLAVLGRLAASISHELRNPLGVITNAVYYLKMVLSDQDAKVQEYLNLIDDQAHKAAKIATNLLEYTRSRLPQREIVQLEPFISHVLTLIPPPPTIRCHTDIPPDLPSIFIDSIHLEQILTNLINNAYQAMPAGGDLSFLAQVAEDYVSLAVQDSGEGMSEKVLAHIFEPLFTTKARGIGLGLAVTQNLIEANGGRIEVESREGEGSTFTLFLPIAKDDEFATSQP